MKKIKKAVLPVAGFGTRFLPATKAIPKEMLPIIDKPLIEYAVEEAVDAGIEEIIFITSHTKVAIENHFDSNFELEEKLEKNDKHQYIPLINPDKFKNVRFTYVRQKSQKGLGDAVAHASHLINDEPFAILLADDLIISDKSCLQQLSEVYYENNTSVIGVNRVDKENISKYGVIEPNTVGKNLFIQNIVEKPSPDKAPSDLAVVGRYVFDSIIFDYLEKVKEDKSNEIQLTDAIQLMLSDHKVSACENYGNKFDCGSKSGYVEATVFMGLKDQDIANALKKYF